MKKKKTKNKITKKNPRVERTQNVVIRVQSQNFPAVIPTETEIIQPMTEVKGKSVNLAITKTWVSDKQIMKMVQRTPQEAVYSRPAKGGGRWNYVTGAYVEKVLNFVFGFMWDFEIVEHGKEEGTIWVKGRLTVKDPAGHQITKMQFGRADIKYKRGTKEMLDFGNDLKAASTDALKKCASLLGIASDIYGTSEYKEETGKDPIRDETVRNQKDNGSMNVSAEDAKVEMSEPIYCHGTAKSGCPDGNEIDRATADYSKKVYGKQLCRDCQKISTPLKK